MRRMSVLFLAVCAAALALPALHADALAAQRVASGTPENGTHVITGRGCADCLSMRRVRIIEDMPEVYGGVSDLGWLPRDSRGRYYHVNYFDESRAHVFAPDGNHVHAIGAPGRGPGEFASISYLLVGAGDSVYVFDGDDRSYSVFDAEHRFVRKTGLNAGYVQEAAQLPSGELVAAGEVHAPEGLGYPLHVVQGDRVVRSFGGIKAADAAGRPIPRVLQREIAVAGDRIVAAHQGSYVIDVFSPTGTLVRQVRRETEEFASFPRSDLRRTFNSLVLDVAVDEEGLVWVLFQSPEPGFEKQTVVSKANLMERLVPKADMQYSDLLDTVIEVLDLDRGEVVATHRLDEVLAAFIGPGYAVGFEQARYGLGRLAVWRITREGGGPPLP